MATAKMGEVTDFLGRLPDALRENVLRGAARAAAQVVATEAKEKCPSEKVRVGIKTKSSEEKGLLVAKVQCTGKAAFIAWFIEYGTRPHLIRVSAEDRGGVSVKTLNGRITEGSLLINGHFVGPVVKHPGTGSEPFMRTALDSRRLDAIAAAQQHINVRIAKAGLFSADPILEGDQ